MNNLFLPARQVFKFEAPAAAEKPIDSLNISSEKLLNMDKGQVEKKITSAKRKMEAALAKIKTPNSPVGRTEVADMKARLERRFTRSAEALRAGHTLLVIKGTLGDAKDLAALRGDAKNAKEAYKATVETLGKHINSRKAEIIGSLELQIKHAGDSQYKAELTQLAAELRDISDKPYKQLSLTELDEWSDSTMKEVESKSFNGTKGTEIAQNLQARERTRDTRNQTINKLNSKASWAKTNIPEDIKGKIIQIVDKLELSGKAIDANTSSTTADWARHQNEVTSKYKLALSMIQDHVDLVEAQENEKDAQESLHADAKREISTVQDLIDDRLDEYSKDRKFARKVGREGWLKLNSLSESLQDPDGSKPELKNQYSSAISDAKLILSDFNLACAQQDVYDAGGKDLALMFEDWKNGKTSMTGEAFLKKFDASLKVIEGKMSGNVYEDADPKLKDLKLAAHTLVEKIHQRGEMEEAIGKSVAKGASWLSNKAGDAIAWGKSALDSFGDKTEQVAEAATELKQNVEAAAIGQIKSDIAAARAKIITKGPGAKAALEDLALAEVYLDDHVDAGDYFDITVPQGVVKDAMSKYQTKLTAYKTKLAKRGKMLTEAGKVVNDPNAKRRPRRYAKKSNTRGLFVVQERRFYNHL